MSPYVSIGDSLPTKGYTLHDQWPGDSAGRQAILIYEQANRLGMCGMRGDAARPGRFGLLHVARTSESRPAGSTRPASACYVHSAAMYPAAQCSVASRAYSLIPAALLPVEPIHCFLLLCCL